jgi:hypothetical protein
MHTSTILLPLLTLFTTTTLAQNGCQGNKAELGYCTTTSFVDLTNSASGPPTTAQCEDACRGVLTDAGDWSVLFENQPLTYRHTMVGFACAFSVGPAAGEPAVYRFDMHNQDIVDIMDEVNRRFGPLHSGRVAARGTMVCQGHTAQWYVD